MNTSHSFFKRAFIFAQILIISLLAIPVLYAQTSSVDTTFNAVVSKDTDNNGNPLSQSFTLQPDGKIIVYGNFQIINGVVKNGIARLNPDGSLDNSFDCPTCDFSVGSVVLQPDGKIVIGGGLLSTYYGTSAARLRRLNSDGSLDTTFYSPYNAGNTPYSITATVSAIQPDGKILVSISTYTGFSNGTSLYRLNADGSLDTSFTKIDFFYGRLQFESVDKVFVLPSGKILVNTNSYSTIRSGGIRRFNSDGTPDTTFEQPTFTGVNTGIGGGFSVNDFEVLADGSILVVGYFNSVNGISRINIVKLLPAGNVDLSFAPPNVFQDSEGISEDEIFSNGRILVRTYLASQIVATPPPTRFVLYNSDGSVNNSFTPPANLVEVSKFVIDGSDNVFLYGSFTENNVQVNKFARLNMTGSLINSFTVNLGIGGSVTKLAIQTDGKVIIAGDFTQVNGVPRKNIARLNADGSFDSTFNTGTGFNGTVEKILVQPDGKILVGGSFSIYNGTAIASLVRLNTDGSLEVNFNPNIAGAVYSIDLQSDNKIIIGGSFNSVNGQTRNGVARLNTDGGLDTSFNPLFGTGAIVRRVLVQTDGKIMIGGGFSGVNGFARTNLVRLNSDGSLDATFNAGNIAGVTLIERQSDGKYVVVTGSTITRLNNDGTADATFAAINTNGTISAVLVQPDGSIIIGGTFTSVGASARQNISRLKPNGAIDAQFLPNGANNSVLAIGRQADGKIIVGGSFSKIENVTPSRHCQIDCRAGTRSRNTV